MAEEKDNKKQDINQFLSDYAYKGGFILTPDPKPFNPKAKYDHFGKDFAITNFRQNNSKRELDEPTQALMIIKGLHVLTNPKHFNIIKIKKLVFIEEREYEYETPEGQTIIIKKPVFEEKEEEEEYSKFPLSYHLLESDLHAFVEVTGSTNGHKSKVAITDRHEKEESIQDKTEVKTKGFFNRGGNKQ